MREKETSLPPNIIDQVRTLKKMSVRELARRSEVSPGNLSGFFRGLPSRLGSEKVARVARTLGLTDTGLLPGVHVWEGESMLLSEMEKIEGTVRTLLPGGMTAVSLKPENDFWGAGGSWDVTVLIPHFSKEVRVVLTLPAMSPKDFFVSTRGLRLGALGKGSRWFGGSLGDQAVPDSCVTLTPSRLDRIRQEAELTVADLDAILGIGPSIVHEWTWEQVTASLSAMGITPEATARKMGLDGRTG